MTPRGRLLTGLVVLLAPLAAATTARADIAARCEGRVIEQPFTAWEDPADYFLAPDGDFSAGAAGWDLAGADVVADNEPWNVHGSETAAAVRIPSGASATSPRTPVAPMPITANTYEMTVAFRFTAHGPDNEWLIDDVYVDPYRKG